QDGAGGPGGGGQSAGLQAGQGGLLRVARRRGLRREKTVWIKRCARRPQARAGVGLQPTELIGSGRRADFRRERASPVLPASRAREGWTSRSDRDEPESCDPQPIGHVAVLRFFWVGTADKGRE